MKKRKHILIGLFVIVLIISLACSEIPGMSSGGKEEVNPLVLTVTANAAMLQQSLTQNPPEPTMLIPEEMNILEEATPTRQYSRSIEEIEALSDEFNSTKLRESWNVYRPLLGKYDLERQRGWLHIVGMPKTGQGYNNVFAQKISDGNLLVVAKIGGVMTEPTQGAWIGFSPGDYSDNSRTVAISLDSYGFGYRAIMWECRTETFCVETTMLGQAKFKYPGSVYLRLLRRGRDYIGHFSEDGKNWVFVGQATDFPVITDQFVLGAGCMNCKNEFDAFFDFVEFTVPK